MGKEILNTLKNLPIKQIFITHHHEDHSGNISVLREHFNCPVFASPLCCEMMRNPPAISLTQRIFWADRPAFFDLQPIEGRIDTPNFSFKIIPVPGHAPDMVALFEPQKKYLFSADLFVNTYIGYFLAGERMAEQIASTERILEFDFEEMFCCHNPQLTGGKEKLEKKLLFLKTFYRRAADLHALGNSPEQIMKKLKLKEMWWVRLLSGGMLSKLNMVRSVTEEEQRKIKT